MTRVIRPLVIVFAVALVAASALVAGPGKATEGQAEGAAAAPTEPTWVRQWHLLRYDGAELYQELCASCHGVAGAGNGPAARALPVQPPALAHLRQAGVSRQHWTYVIQSGCEDSHHWASSGIETMPCWQRIFRKSLDNEAATLLVSTKLADYIESIQQ